MKKTIIGILACSACFYAGWYLGLKWYNVDSLYEANSFKRELLDSQWDVINRADYLLDKHDIADIDGSDEFSDYLDARCRVDSLLMTQL